MRPLAFALLAFAVCPCTFANAQNGSDAGAAKATGPTPTATYKLTFTVRELAAGKLVGSRSYTSLFRTDRESPSGSIRAGDKVPVKSISGKEEVNYSDNRVSIDFRAPSSPILGSAELALFIDADVTGTLEQPHDQAQQLPIVHNNQWRSSVLVKLGKSTLLFSSDDPVVDRTMEIDLLAVPLP